MRSMIQFATIILLASSLHARAADLQEAIRSGFQAVRALNPMRPGVIYTVQVAGSAEVGHKDQFLRRRTAHEISQSGLSCGCGDNALVFLECVEGQGKAVLLVDAAEVSSASLVTTFSGHAVVAVGEVGSSANWQLVDTTNLRVISEHWSKDDRSFKAFGRLFWVGYCGLAADYHVRGPEELRRFYKTTLATVPRTTLSGVIVRLKFSIDPSFLNSDGALVNPRISEFVTLQDRILREQAIEPTRTVPILLKRGGDDARTDLVYSESQGWAANVGTRSGCSPSLLDYFEQKVGQANDGSVPITNHPSEPSPSEVH